MQVLICIGTVYWAIAETLGIAGAAALVLATIFALPLAYVLFIAVRMAYEAETDPATNSNKFQERVQRFPSGIA